MIRRMYFKENKEKNIKVGDIIRNEYDGLKSKIIEIKKDGILVKLIDKKGLKKEFGKNGEEIKALHKSEEFLTLKQLEQAWETLKGKKIVL